ncbi:hypothetical protein TL16_g00454 [Triparma laevis f. inornata]|uniref:Peptidase S54 rhomboid domain-containing protein n=1 Tax=Triparma laevis f. inornata TaxID=1714386 RepID=A0A9W7DMM0_9STRA|nr:hypothetical protein TL16_g00454 [Triparma laevis f. inornata]
MFQISSALACNKYIQKIAPNFGYGSQIQSLLLGGTQIQRLIRVSTGKQMMLSSNGPLHGDLLFQPQLCLTQPHRFLSSSLLHGNLIHLYCNYSTISSIPNFLTPPLYFLTFLISTIFGNLTHWYFSSNPVLGASGGICGLFGCAYYVLQKNGKKRQADAMGKSMLYMLIYGLLSGGRVSNSSHVGGFLSGLGCGYFFGPNFKKEYCSKRAPNRNPLFDKDQGYMNGRRIGQGVLPVYIGYVFLAILGLLAGNANGGGIFPGRVILGFWYSLRFPGLISNTVA